MPIAGGILVAGTAAHCWSSAAGMLRFLARLSGQHAIHLFYPLDGTSETFDGRLVDYFSFQQGKSHAAHARGIATEKN